MTIMRNTPYPELQVGMTAEAHRLCVADDLYVFAHASGNHNPLNLPSHKTRRDPELEPIAPGMWVAALISSVLGNELPGPGTVYKSQSLNFVGRAHAGDQLTARVTLTAKGPDNEVTFATSVLRADGKVIVEGEAVVIAPATAQSFDSADLPGLQVQRHRHFDAMLAEAEPYDPIPTAVVAPEDAHSLGGALLGRDHTLITPILIGNPGPDRGGGRGDRGPTSRGWN